MSEPRSGYILSLSEEDEAFARDQLHEVKEELPAALASLRQWLMKQTHFQCSTNEQLLLGFIRKARHVRDDPRRLLEEHVRARLTQPGARCYLNVPRLDTGVQRALDAGIVMALPGLAKNGSRVLVYRHALHGHVSSDDAYKALNMSIDVIMLDPVAQVRGAILISDYSDTGFRALANMTLDLVHLCGLGMSAHGRLHFRSVHQVHTVHFVAGMRVALKTLLAERATPIHDHGSDVSALQRIVPTDHLPAELEGRAEGYEVFARHWCQHVLEHVAQLSWLEELSYMNSDYLGAEL